LKQNTDDWSEGLTVFPLSAP